MRILVLLIVVLSVTASARADFGRDALGFVGKHCAACHGGKKPKADLTLDGYRDEPSALKARKVWQAVLDQVEAGQMPPAGKPRPAPAEIEAFAKAVRGAFDRADRAAPPDPGRVTARRLNRAEYRNTIRDLVGVDFDPTEDFPSDDIGHGFDNIGDVLSLSPVLLERYLAAAEAVVDRAILPDPPKPPERYLTTRYAEPSSANPPFKGRCRRMTTTPDAASKSPHVETGPLFTSYKVPSDGEYVFRVRAYVDPESKGPVRIALLAQGTSIPTPATDAEIGKLSGHSVANLKPFIVLKIAEVTAKEEAKAQNFEARVPANIGLHRCAVALLKADDGQPVSAWIEWLALIGPLDTRPASHRRILARDEAKPKPEQTREVLTRFVTRAYRRPPTPAELDRLVGLVASAEGRGLKWEAGIRLAIQAVLVSPKFLFRIEQDDRPEGTAPKPLDDYQLASRLSYFLWSTMPDAELLALAGKKQLAAQIEPQVRRMLKDPRSSALVDNFALQWLQLRRLKVHAPDGKLFPKFDERLRAAMLGETERFFASVIAEDRSVLDLIDANYTFLNERLAQHYGIVDTAGTRAGQKPTGTPGKPIKGPDLVRVALAPGERGGLLTQASVLTVTSNPTRTSPVKRGRWVLEQLLGTPPPPPPPDVPELDNPKTPLTGTLRQRMEQHRADARCAGCHARMDPLGFAFENFDAIGAFRATDAGLPIDASGTLPDGRSFRGPAELKTILKGKKELFARCLTEKLLTYALGRGLEIYDRPAVDRITAALARDNYRFSTLAVEIARSEPFRMRR